MGKFWLAIGLYIGAIANALATVPPELQHWQDWVLEGHPDIRCPHLHDHAQRSCVWPNQLQLHLNEKEGRFELEVETFADAWVTLPGSDNHWPQHVNSRNDKGSANPVPVVSRDQKPQVHLPVGRYRLQGVWQWDSLPRTLAVPEATGLLQLTLHGVAVADPQRTTANELWLTAQREEPKEQATDALEIEVLRHISDGNPAVIETLVNLNVSGRERELHTGPILLDGFQPRAFSSELPARVERDGRLRVQVKAGRWQIRLIAHQSKPLTAIHFQPQDALWPTQEIWVFASNPQLRAVELSGLKSFDSTQANVPSEWSTLPTFLAEAGNTLTLRELQRGAANTQREKAQITKRLWLDFSGQAFTVRDEIRSSQSLARIEAMPEYQVSRAESGRQSLLVSQLPGRDVHGVEIRSPNLDVRTVSRVAQADTLPVKGWDLDVDVVDWTLILPNGWSVLHASAHSVSGSWLSRWDLWDVFLVLLVSIGLARSTTLLIGGTAFAALIVTYMRTDAPIAIWLNFAAIFALLPFATGRWRTWITRYFWICMVFLVLMLIPFATQQARQMLYIQLDNLEEGDWMTHSAVDAITSEYIEEKSLGQSIREGLSDTAMSRKNEAREDYRQYVTAVPASVKPSVKVAETQQRYDPGQQIQAGVALPKWNGRHVDLTWNGPIATDTRVNVYWVKPWQNRVGSFFALTLPLVLMTLLLLHFFRRTPNPPAWWTQVERSIASWQKPEVSRRVNALGAGMVLVLGLGVSGMSSPVQASVQIHSELLQELEARLTKPATCLPDCAAIESVHLTDTADTLTVKMRVSSMSDIAFPLPAQITGWYPQNVWVNGKAAAWLQAENAQLWVRLTPGTHDVVLQGATQGKELISLPFRLPLRNVQVALSHWQASGIPTAQRQSQNLQLKREEEQLPDQAAPRLLPDAIAPYVVVTRTLHIGLEWRIQTEVRRVAPETGPIHLRIPLVPGESPTSSQVVDGMMDVRLDPSQRHYEWQSTLKPFEEMTLVAPNNTSWAEVWSLNLSPSWHAEFNGIPALHSDRNLWQPWPEEQLTIQVTRPKAVEGNNLSVDEVGLNIWPGANMDSIDLFLSIRATQGDYFNLNLPAGMILKNVRRNDKSIVVSQVDNTVRVPINPSLQKLHFQLQQPVGNPLIRRTPQWDLGLPLNNIEIFIKKPQDRWLLGVGGPTKGPALLLWSTLLVIVILAIGLAKSGLTPLRMYEWILLSLGVATLNLFVLVPIAAWFIVMTLRGRLQAPPQSKLFNVQQVMLYGFSFVMLIVLCSSIPMSLLSNPEMLVMGNASSNTELNWYQDFADGAVPQAWMFTVPMWVYRVVMLAWSLWVVMALMRWIPWAWRNLGVQGYWLSKATASSEPNSQGGNKTPQAENNIP